MLSTLLGLVPLIVGVASGVVMDVALAGASAADGRSAAAIGFIVNVASGVVMNAAVAGAGATDGGSATALKT